jgi:hypothetical protein
MAKLMDKVVRNWDMQAQPFMDKEKKLKDKIAQSAPEEDDGFFSIFNGFGNPDSRSSLEARLANVQSRQLELAQVFTLRILKQAAGSDGAFNKHYADYKRKREAECPQWPMVSSSADRRHDYVLRFFLLQRVNLPQDQAHVVDQMLEFYKHDKSLPETYRPEKDMDSWLKNFDL